MKTVVITGSGGQVGRELQKCFWPDDFMLNAYDKHELDISDAKSVDAKIGSSANIVINAAAYTAVDRAEIDKEQAWRINTKGAGILARRCAELDIPLLHVSTDYVFDGAKGTSYFEDDETNPLNEYGKSKLGGESAIRATAPHHVIMRTASVFSEYGTNFVKSMLRLGEDRPRLSIVDDQVSCPTAAADIANALKQIAGRILSDRSPSAFGGTYHFCGGPAVSWYDFASEIFSRAAIFGKRSPVLDRIKAIEFPSTVKRPAYSAMNCDKIKQVFDIAAPSWSERLPQVLQAII